MRSIRKVSILLTIIISLIFLVTTSAEKVYVMKFSWIDQPDPFGQSTKGLKMKYFENLKSAISYAFNKYGEDIKILIIKKPDLVIPLYNAPKGGES